MELSMSNWYQSKLRSFCFICITKVLCICNNDYHFSFQAFVDLFSHALEWEYSGSGITVQTITPSYVSTNMTKFIGLVQQPSEFYKQNLLFCITVSNFTMKIQEIF